MIRWRWTPPVLRCNFGYEVWWEQYARRVFVNLLAGSPWLYLRDGRLDNEPEGWANDDS